MKLIDLLKNTLLFILLGLTVGLCIVLFIYVIMQIYDAYSYLYQQLNAITFYGVTFISIFMVIFLTKKWAPEASGSGIPQIKYILASQSDIRWWRVIPVKFSLGALAIGSGMFLGREGPSVHIGGSIGSMLAHCMKRNSTADRMNLIAAGSATGLAVAFNAPLAAIMFIIEEMRREYTLDYKRIIFVFISILAALMMSYMLGGNHLVAKLPDLATPSYTQWLGFFAAGIFVGLVGVAYNKTLLFVRPRFKSLDNKLWGQVLLAVTVTLSIYLFDNITGYRANADIGQIRNLLVDKHELMFVVVLTISSFCLSIICFCSGSPGGILAPLVIIGSLCGLISSEVHGLLIGSATPVHLEIHVIAAIGGLFAATIQSPITGILLIIEMTHTYDQIVPILLAATVASLVSQLCNTNAIFDDMLAQDLLEKDNPKQ